MGVWELMLVGLVMLLGLGGVLVPGVPGPWLVWAATLWWALQDRSGLAWVVLVSATALLLIAQAVRWQLPSRRVRGVGSDRRLAAWAGGGAVLGFFVPPVIGVVPGFLGGLYTAERLRLGRHDAAAASVREVMRTVGTSVLVELYACLLVAGAWLGAVIWGS